MVFKPIRYNLDQKPPKDYFFQVWGGLTFRQDILTATISSKLGGGGLTFRPDILTATTKRGYDVQDWKIIPG